MILDEGLNKLASNAATIITNAQWGTGTALPSASDTELGSAIATTLIAVTSSVSGNTVQFTHEVPSTAGNGYNLTEHELQFSTGESLNRSLGGEITKIASYELTTIVTVSFLRG